MKTRLLLRGILSLIISLIAVIGLSSCVHEFPKMPGRRVVAVHFRHELPWSLFYFNLPARSSGIAYGTSVGYTVEVYPHGNTEFCVERIHFVSEDITLSEFTRNISLPVGHYDLWVWSDYVDSQTGNALFYNSTNFGGITLTEPYRGDTYMKDAFQGMVEIDIPDTDRNELDIETEVVLRRPLTGYALVANDLNEFIEQETRRLSPEDPSPLHAPVLDFDSYTARVTYTGYIPYLYSMFRNKPIDSMLGVAYEGPINITDSGDAILAFDTVLINGDESTLTLAIEVFDEKGELLSAMGGIVFPTKRNRATIVTAAFLTTKAQGGVNINTAFDNDFNIKI